MPVIMKTLLLAAIFSLVPAVLGASVCSAQDVDPRQTAMARSLFEEGVRFADQNEWGQAADRFERAIALRNSATIAFNLATAYEHLGRLVEAAEHLSHIAHDARADSRVQASAAALLAQIRPRIAHLTVRVTGPRDGTLFEIDGHSLPVAALGVSTPVDPGQHVVRALRNGNEVATSTVEVSTGAESSASLELPALPTVDPNLAVQNGGTGTTGNSSIVVGDAGGPPRDEASGTPWGWIVVGGVAVAAAVVVVLLVTQGSTRDPVSGDSNPAVLQW